MIVKGSSRFARGHQTTRSSSPPVSRTCPSYGVDSDYIQCITEDVASTEHAGHPVHDYSNRAI